MLTHPYYVDKRRSVLLNVNLMLHKCIKYLTPTINFRLANYDSINAALSSINWENLFKNFDVNECVDLFYKKYT